MRARCVYHATMQRYLHRFTLLIALGLLMVLAGCIARPTEPVPTAPIVPASTQPAAALPTNAPPVAATTAPVETVTDPPTATASPAPTDLPTRTDIPAPTAAAPVTLADSIVLREVVRGFERPLYVTNAGDARLFVVEQTGRIRIVSDGAVQAGAFLNISDRITTRGNEQGLLGLAFHPAYADNGRFFVYYTRASDGAVVIAEYATSADPNLAAANSERILVTIGQPFANHNGGQIAFGPDGYLYAGVGDGGAADDPLDSGQDLATLLGALLRMDVDQGQPYGVPADNPFAGDGRWRGEIWAWGLRNPWRFSFDRLTGDLYIADVGQNRYEEINFQPAASTGGENYGWSRYEAFDCYQNGCEAITATFPVLAYDHGNGCSVTGGYVYRGSQFPALTGNYLYADYCSGMIWAALRPAEGDWPTQVVLDSDLIISSFGEDVAGELYVLDHSGGALYQITD